MSAIPHSDLSFNNTLVKGQGAKTGEPSNRAKQFSVGYQRGIRQENILKYSSND
jgi:hypothetical protein